jgi:hypothetical protein
MMASLSLKKEIWTKTYRRKTLCQNGKKITVCKPRREALE